MTTCAKWQGSAARRAIVATCLFSAVQLVEVARAQTDSILVTNGSTATIPGTYATGTYSTIGVSDGGRLSLLSGTVSAFELSVSGSGGLQQAGGRYEVDALLLSNSTTVLFNDGDVVGRNQYGRIQVDSGSTLELRTNLTGTYGYWVSLSGSGSGIARGTGAEVFEIGELDVVDGANLALLPGDEIGGVWVGDYFQVGGWAPSTVTLPLGAASFTPAALFLGRGGSVAGLEAVPYSVMSLGVAAQRIVVRSGTITDSVGEAISIRDSGTVSLQQPLSLGSLDVSGSGSRLESNGFSVSTSYLSVSAGASMTVGGLVSVSEGLSVESGMSDAPTDVTLAASLVLSSTAYSPTLSLSGEQARLTRSSTAVTITAPGAYVSVASGSFAMQSGDNLTGSDLSVYAGGVLTQAGPLTCASLYVSGSSQQTGRRSTYVAHGPLTISDTTAMQSPLLFVSDGVVRLEAGASLPELLLYGGAVEVASGTLAVIDSMEVSGSLATVVLNRAAGASLNVATLRVNNGGFVECDPTRDSVGNLAVFDDSAVGLGLTAGTLALDSLYLTFGGLLDAGNGGATVANGLTLVELLARLAEGRGDGSWNGTTGITSSAAAAALAASVPRTMGWLDNGDGSLSFAFAAPADTNLDWTVDILDGANFLAGGKFDSGQPASWNEGDFGYDGVVDILDAADFLSTNLFDAGPYNSASGRAGLVAAVPEPATGGILALAAVCWAIRRLRRDLHGCFTEGPSQSSSPDR